MPEHIYPYSITFFQEFLHSYNRHPSVADDDEEEAADPLEMRIADAAYAAEDAIESHIVKSIKHKNRKYKEANDDKKNKSMINRCCGILQSVIQEMDSIEKMIIVDTLKTKKPLMMVVHDQVPITNHVTASENLVGSDGVVLEIMEKLAGGQLDCQVIPIVGMGGIGKIFLAQTIYAKPFVKERFDICAWATISQNYDTREIMCEILSQATNRKIELSGKSVDELGLELHKYLFSRRFLIVMDDMWSIDSWDKIQRFFPNNCNGSRVLVTTRLSQLSLQLNNDYSLRMSFLDKASSWDLFSKTVFGDKSSCPPELEEIGVKIVDNCRGLPLSIAVVGGLLKMMDATRASWESVRDNFTSVVNMNNDKHCLRLLKLSYNHLPVYLKPCFLYMAVFEEDENIRVSTLVHLWVSEGFLKPTNGEALEKTARGFLQDLVDRNLILIGKLGCTGRLRFCKMHDLVRDMCLKECQKQGFYHFIGKHNSPPQGVNAQRRVVVPWDTSMGNIRGELRFMSHTRSIRCEDGDVALCRNLVLLRTFQALKGFSTYGSEFPLDLLVFRYVNLRHIAIRAPNMWSFLPSISRLWNLHTLIISYYHFSNPILVADFWKMPQFRHLEFSYDCAFLPDPPSSDGDAVVVMENLHTLKGIRNFKCSEGVVKRIPNVKRLKLEYIDYDDECDDVNYNVNDNDVYGDDGYDGDEDEDDDDGNVGDGNVGDDDSNGDSYVNHIGNMKNLCGIEFLSIGFLPPCSVTLRQNITFPHSLKKLSVAMGSYSEWSDMFEKIGSLPLLEKLKLSYGRFGKGEWEIAERQFPSLKSLSLDNCGGLENMTAKEQDSYILPGLEHLKLKDLEELKTIPFELGNTDTLKSIKLICCGEGAVKSAKEMFDEQIKLQGGEDQLSFHVEVTVREKQQHLMSLAGSNFYVKIR